MRTRAPTLPVVPNPSGGRYTPWAPPKGSFRPSSITSRTTSVAAQIVAAGRPSENQMPISKQLMAQQFQRLLFGVQSAAVDAATDAHAGIDIAPKQLRTFSLALSSLAKNSPYEAFRNAQIVALGYTPPSQSIEAPVALRLTAEAWMLTNIDRNVRKAPAILGACSYILVTGLGSPPFRRLLAEKCLKHALVPKGKQMNISDCVFSALFGLVDEMPDVAARAQDMLLSADLPSTKRELGAYKALTQG